MGSRALFPLMSRSCYFLLWLVVLVFWQRRKRENNSAASKIQEAEVGDTLRFRVFLYCHDARPSVRTGEGVSNLRLEEF